MATGGASASTWTATTSTWAGTSVAFASMGSRGTVSRIRGCRTPTRAPCRSPLPARPLSLFDASRDDDRETTQLELRLSSSDDTALDWVVGGFYQQNNDVFCVAQMLGINEFFGDPTGNSVPSILCNQQDADAWAVFGDVSWTSPTSSRSAPARAGRRRKRSGPAGRRPRSKHITGGLSWRRLQRASRPGRLRPHGLAGQCRGTQPRRDLVGTDVHRAGRLPVHGRHQQLPALRPWLQERRLQRPDGYGDGHPGRLPAPYDPEFADSYEAGLKTSWLENRAAPQRRDLLRGVHRCAARTGHARLRTQHGGRCHYCDDGVTQGTQFQETRFFNAADVTVQGFELEGTGLVTDNFTLVRERLVQRRQVRQV